MMNPRILLVLTAGLVQTVAWGARTGSCESKAADISFSPSGAVRTVQLVPAYDSEDETEDPTQGVYFFKAKLSRGKGYTVWTVGLPIPPEGSTNEVVNLSAYAADASESSDSDGPSAEFTEYEDLGADQRLILHAEDWTTDEEEKEDNDPSSWTYYVQLEGDVGDSVTVWFQQGEILPAGVEDNPQFVTPQTGVTSLSRKLQVGDEYYFRTRLTAGTLYWFGTSGGSATNVLSMSISSDNGDGETDDDDSGFSIFSDPDYDDDDFNEGCYLIPDETGYFSIVVSGGDPEVQSERSFGLPFGFAHRRFAARAIGAHEALPLAESVTFSPGLSNARESVKAGFFDPIVDEALFSFPVVKDGRYLLRTEEARTNLLMRVYDAKGKVLFENTGDGQSFNVRCAFQATATGDCYVGVCQNLEDEFNDEAAYLPVRLVLSAAPSVSGSPDEWDDRDDRAAGATPLAPKPGAPGQSVFEADTEGHGWHRLDAGDWQDVFCIAGRKGVTYALGVSLEDEAAAFNSLKAEVFTLSMGREVAVAGTGDVNVGSAVPFAFTAAANATHYIRLSVREGQGLDFPKYRVHAMGYRTDGAALGILTVHTKGVDGTWSLGGETVDYPSGSSVLVSGQQTIKFGAVAGYKVDAATKSCAVGAGETVVLTGLYSDVFDPKDDVESGATAWTLKNMVTTQTRTLWQNDLADTFAIAGKDGCYFDFELRNGAGCDAVLTLVNAQSGVLAEAVTSVRHLHLPASPAKYFLTVHHSGSGEGGYAIDGLMANVGAIKLAKTAVAVKENAPSVTVTVNRTAKEGKVRVRYSTVAGTAVPGVDYRAQNGVLEWAANDNKAKNIVITLIPDLVEIDEGGNKTFSLKLWPMEDAELSEDEYPAAIVGGDVCTVTLTEAARAGTTVASVYAAKAPRPAVVTTEKVAVETGSFTALLAAQDGALTNGLPKLASVALTVSAATPAALSAKVQLAGKTYSFAAKGWDDSDEETCAKTMELVQKVNNVAYTNRLSLTVSRGRTEDGESWLTAGGSVELVMNVPDANMKGVQRDVRYAGELVRNNAKIQDYLTAVTNFTGYYTIALPSGVASDSGLPAGNGYLTLTLDNKGTAKVAGLLPDGTTKVSLSVPACSIRRDAASANGYALRVPLFFSKAPTCFGGVLRLIAVGTDEQPSGAMAAVVADAASGFVWNNDSPAATYQNMEGFSLSLAPCGGWYDTVFNLQTYYLDSAISIGTTTSFPKESVPAGYVLSSVAQPDGTPVTLVGNTVSVPKRVLVKNGMVVDLPASVNPCNVTLKFARATGLLTGSCSLWAESLSGTAPKEVTGLKAFGVLVPMRDPGAPLGEKTIAAGLLTQAVKIAQTNAQTGVKTYRTWTFSAPFDLLAAERVPGPDEGELE